MFPVKNTRNILHPSVPATDRQRYQRPSRHVTAGAGSDGDRLQQLPAVLPCDVRVVAQTHPLFGRVLAARSFIGSRSCLTGACGRAGTPSACADGRGCPNRTVRRSALSP